MENLKDNATKVGVFGAKVIGLGLGVIVIGYISKLSKDTSKDLGGQIERGIRHIIENSKN